MKIVVIDNPICEDSFLREFLDEEIKYSNNALKKLWLFSLHIKCNIYRDIFRHSHNVRKKAL